MSGELPDRPRHAEAGNLLSLVGKPSLLESFTVEEIKAMFTKAGYEETENGSATIGWARRLGQPDA